MEPYYYNELPSMPTEEGLVALGMIILGVLGVILLFGLAFWIMRSMSLHAIARRRGIRHAWLAWIPLGGQWILGSVADQYQHLVQGKVTSRRKILLILGVAGFLVGIVYVVFSGIISFLAETGDEEGMLVLASMIPYLLTVGISIATMVFYHMSNYDLYRSCNPKNAVVFLVLGIIIPVTEPFFYLSCRKKDLGMVVPVPATPEPAELPRANPEF